MCNVADITRSAANSMHSATHKDHRGELTNSFVFCQPITDVYFGQLTNEIAQFLQGCIF